ncbi:MAG: zeta toxin family protein [Verrucomicrobia bacterium]|nr:zeta toxin family protein [Verrucomicrobiota bacterium]MDA1069358.1 zeta toxin family protein [Verrucomicrobiota bacterium]
MPIPPTIYVLAGVNGSGKSSILGAYLLEHGLTFYNPDEAAAVILRIHPRIDQFLANGHAWTMGKDLLQKAITNKRSFAFETTLGGHTITQLLINAAESGLRLVISYVGLKRVDLNIARVNQRVQKGGHTIPEEKIRERWDRSRENLIKLIPHASSLRVFDNSEQSNILDGERPSLKLLLDIRDRKLVFPKEPLAAPDWVKPILMAALQEFRD